MKKTTRTVPPLMDRIRLALGLRWRSSRPSLANPREALRDAALVVGIFLIFGFVGKLDYETERAMEMEAHAVMVAGRAAVADDMEARYRFARNHAEQLEDYLVACLNGDRELVLGGQRWACKATPVGPYIPQEN
jgi:hypothetical protein